MENYEQQIQSRISVLTKSNGVEVQAPTGSKNIQLIDNDVFQDTDGSGDHFTAARARAIQGIDDQIAYLQNLKTEVNNHFDEREAEYNS